MTAVFVSPVRDPPGPARFNPALRGPPIHPGTGGIQFAQGANGARTDGLLVAGASFNEDSAGVVKGTDNEARLLRRGEIPAGPSS
jgi:hypothetical protein